LPLRSLEGDPFAVGENRAQTSRAIDGQTPNVLTIFVRGPDIAR
jgi:hypothetical protein